VTTDAAAASIDRLYDRGVEAAAYAVVWGAEVNAGEGLQEPYPLRLQRSGSSSQPDAGPSTVPPTTPCAVAQ
jgi:hypothetical protein